MKNRLNRGLLLIGAVSTLLGQPALEPPPAYSTPNCKCDGSWCYVNQGARWEPVSPGAMRRGFALACGQAWQNYRRGYSQPSGNTDAYIRRRNRQADRIDRERKYLLDSLKQDNCLASSSGC